jgi:hypothetical protein
MTGRTNWPRIVGLLALAIAWNWSNARRADVDNEFKIEAGAMRDYRLPRNAFYYRVDYQGMTLKDYGKSFDATPDPNLVLAKQIVAKSDSGDISIRFERGNLGASSDLFSAVGIKPLSATLPALRRLRGTAQAYGALDGKSTTYAVGVETPPFHAPPALGLSKASVAHWLVLGIQAEHRRRDTTTTEFQDASSMQARWYAGRGIGPRGHTDQQRNELRAAMDSVRSRVKTYREAAALNQEWKTKHKGQARPAMESVISAIVGGLSDQVDGMSEADRVRIMDDPAWWAERLTDWAEAVPGDQPRSALWFDGYVRREFGADRISDAPLQLMRVQLQVWLSLENPSQGWITLAYVNGFDRATPGIRREQLLMTFGVSF